MRLSEVLDTLRPADRGWAAEAPASWAQGRTLFGGLQAALLVAAMRQHVPADVPLRSLQTTFVGPVPAGTVHIQVQVLREGKSAIHVQAHTHNAEGLGCTAIAVFGRRRESSIVIEPPAPLVALSPTRAPLQPYVEGVSPAFLQHAQQRFARGAMPFCGGSEARTQIYVRYPGESRVTEALVIAIADTIPSPAISLLKRFAFASSMTWTLELLRDDLTQLPIGDWLMDAEVTSARDGYAFQTATLWSPDHRAVALSRQSAVIFA